MLAGQPDNLGAFELEIMKVLQIFLPTYNDVNDGEGGHWVYKRTPQGLSALGHVEGKGTPENTFRGAGRLNRLSKEEKKQLYWKSVCSSSTCDRTNTLMRLFAELSDKNFTLLHKGVKVVNIYKVRGYLPLEGLEKEFMFEYPSKRQAPRHSFRLHHVLSEYLALYKNFAPRDEECDRVVKEAQTKAIAKARGVGTDDISIHFWVVLTLENRTMLHVDAVGPTYDCYEYEEKTGVPLVLRVTPELLLEEPKGDLKVLYPDAVVLTNKCLDGTKAELPEWRVFDSFDVYPAEALFLDQFMRRGQHVKEKGSATSVINLAVSMLFCAKLVEAQEDLHVELYNLPSERFNGAKGKIDCCINVKDYLKEDPLDGSLSCRFPVTLTQLGKTLLVKHENIMLLPKVKSQYLLWRQLDKKMGWKHRLCNCVDWKKGLYTRKGLNYPVYDCDEDCDHEMSDREDEEIRCPSCHGGCHMFGARW